MNPVPSLLRLARTRLRPPAARRGAWLLLLAGLGCCSAALAQADAAAPLSAARIAEIIASPDRSAADLRNDLRRKPAQMLAFAGVRAGDTVLDLSTGGGYTTELLARAVGPSGRAYGQSQPPRDAHAPALAPATPEGNSMPQLGAAPTGTPAPRRSAPEMLAQRASNLGSANLFSVVRVFEDPVPPELVGQLDLVTLMFNYHDLGHLGSDRSKMNAAIFAALKPGALYVIADHAGRDGTGISESGTLHRIEEAFLRQEVEAAGFKFVARADFLHNPADPRDHNTPEGGQAKDEFVLKFMKPM